MTTLTQNPFHEMYEQLNMIIIGISESLDKGTFRFVDDFNQH